jgi:hypothetical protein
MVEAPHSSCEARHLNQAAFFVRVIGQLGTMVGFSLSSTYPQILLGGTTFVSLTSEPFLSAVLQSHEAPCNDI